MLRPWAIIVYIVMMCCAIVAFTGKNARGAEPEWVLLDENEDSLFYFDQGGTVTDREGISKVRTRVVYTDQGKADALKILGDDQFAKLSETRYLYALDCRTVQSRLLEAKHLDQQGAVLKTTDLSAATEWEEVAPHGRMALVLAKACAY